DPDCQTRAANHLRRERLDACAGAGVRVREAARQIVHDSVEVLLGYPARYTGLHPRDGVREMPVADSICRQIEAKGPPQRDRVALQRRAIVTADMLKSGGHYADNGPVLAVQPHGFADDAWIGLEPALPE